MRPSVYQTVNLMYTSKVAIVPKDGHNRSVKPDSEIAIIVDFVSCNVDLEGCAKTLVLKAGGLLRIPRTNLDFERKREDSG